MTERKKFSRYSKAFKERAIRLAEEIGGTRAARVLGMQPSTLVMMTRLETMKMKCASANSPEEKALREAELEIKKLNKEIEDLRKANLILRDLAAVFSKDPLPKLMIFQEATLP